MLLCWSTSAPVTCSLLDVAADRRCLSDQLAALLQASCTLASFVQTVLISRFAADPAAKLRFVNRAELPGRDINDLLQREPLMLTANIRFALQELKRLTPAKDSAEFLFKNPGLVLAMDEQMMESTIDGDLTQI